MKSIKKQKGYTLIELVICLVFGGAVLIGLFALVCGVYAAGKFLFGWWG